VPLSTQMHKWVPEILILTGGKTAMDWHPIQEREELLVASCYRNQDKLWPVGPRFSYADIT